VGAERLHSNCHTTRRVISVISVSEREEREAISDTEHPVDEWGLCRDCERKETRITSGDGGEIERAAILRNRNSRYRKNLSEEEKEQEEEGEGSLKIPVRDRRTGKYEDEQEGGKKPKKQNRGGAK
jgi:hypothetical protein